MKIGFKPLLIATLAAFGLFAGASAASADDINWNGMYVGVNAGGAFGTSHATTTTVFSPVGYFATTSVPAIAATGNQSMSPSAFVGGLELGYDWRFDNNIVLGLEGEIVVNNVGSHIATSATYPCCAPTAFTVASSVTTNWMATVRPRLGYVMEDNSLLYATGGYAVTNEHVGFTFSDTFATAFSSGLKKSDQSGWAVGAGYAIPWGKGLSVKIEYLYADFGKVTVPGSVLTAFTPPIAFPANPFVHTSTLQENIVRFGVDYHFQ